MEKPKDIPDVVYKYRNWSDNYHKRILLKNELYLTSPKDFNDPFDCRIPINFLSLDTPEKIRAFVEKATNEHLEYLLAESRDIEFEKKKLENQLLTDLEGYQKYYQNGWFKFHDERLGVLSLSKRWDSILMWSHYANKHQGFCVGFHEEKLRESDLFGRGGLVDYDPEDKFPFLDPMEEDRLRRIFIETQSKANDWKYEEEYRLFKTFYNGVPSVEERKSYFSDEVFAEVIVGLNISEKDKEEIVTICRTKRIKVYQAEKIPFFFKMNRKEI
jgi:hypothetical protein